MKLKSGLNNSELKIMNILWEQGEIPAKEVARIAGERYDWNKNTTYTILKTLIEKGAMERVEPNFLCRPLLEISQVRRTETKGLIDRLFGGSSHAFLSTFFEEESLSQRQIAEIQKIIDGGD